MTDRPLGAVGLKTHRFVADERYGSVMFRLGRMASGPRNRGMGLAPSALAVAARFGSLAGPSQAMAQ